MSKIFSSPILMKLKIWNPYDPKIRHIKIWAESETNIFFLTRRVLSSLFGIVWKLKKLRSATMPLKMKLSKKSLQDPSSCIKIHIFWDFQPFTFKDKDYSNFSIFWKIQRGDHSMSKFFRLRFCSNFIWWIFGP